MTPQKTPKQKGAFMGFSGTFARLKSRLSNMAETKLDMDPMDLEIKPQVDRLRW
jgi:hypothetical protein